VNRLFRPVSAITDQCFLHNALMDAKAQPGKLWIDPDEIEVVRSFLACGVRFLVVGGRAVQFHGHMRPARDPDLLVEFSASNWDKLLRALPSLNAAVPAFATLSAEKPERGVFNGPRRRDVRRGLE
jgi:hypothetical protein